MHTSALLLMGGSGKRFESSLPKQFHNLAGKKIYLHTLEVFLESALFQEIILVCPKEWKSEVEKEISHYHICIKVISGGSSRQESSYLGLLACSPLTKIVVLHDAVRPFVTFEILERNKKAAQLFAAVDTCIPSTDTIVHSKDQKEIHYIPPRSEYLRGQTPQSFSYDLILSAHRLALQEGIFNSSDDCALVLKAGYPVHIVNGSEDNIKITTELDLFLAEQILLRVGTKNRSEISQTLQEKKFAVVGGTGGIGRWICSLLQEEGALPLIVSRTSHSFAADLTDKHSIMNAFHKIYTEYGPIDGLINAAGFLKIKPFQELKLDEIEELLAVNLLGLLYCCHAVKLKESAHIVNIASSSFTRGREGYGIYSSAKAAVVNFTQSLALEQKNLRINVIVPQRTNTPMRISNFPSEQNEDLLHPKEVALAVINLLKDPYLTGTIIEVKKK